MAAETLREPPQATITQLKKQAKELRQAARSGDREARRRGRWAPGHLADGVGRVGSQGRPVRPGARVRVRRLEPVERRGGERMIEQRDLHRWFGVQLNNGMWDAIEDPSVGPDSPTDTRSGSSTPPMRRPTTGSTWVTRRTAPVASTSSPGWRSRSASTNWGPPRPALSGADRGPPRGDGGLGRAVRPRGAGPRPRRHRRTAAAEQHRAKAVELTAAITDPGIARSSRVSSPRSPGSV